MMKFSDRYSNIHIMNTSEKFHLRNYHIRKILFFMELGMEFKNKIYSPNYITGQTELYQRKKNKKSISLPHACGSLERRSDGRSLRAHQGINFSLANILIPTPILRVPGEVFSLKNNWGMRKLMVMEVITKEITRLGRY